MTARISQSRQAEESCCLFFCAGFWMIFAVFCFLIRAVQRWYSDSLALQRSMERAFDGSNIAKQAGERIVLPVFMQLSG